MSSRYYWLALVALLVLVAIGAALAWPTLNSRRGLVVRDDSRASRVLEDEQQNTEPRNTRPAGCAPKCGGVISGAKPEPPVDAKPRYDMSTLGEGDILVRAQVRLSSPYGLDIYRLLDRGNASICVRFVESDNDPQDTFWDADETGLVEMPCARENMPLNDKGVKPGTWSARVCWGEKEAFNPIPAPKLEERLLDFGTLTFDISDALDDGEWLLIGRLVHTSGLPITAFDGLCLGIGEQDDRYYLGPMPDGRFGMPVSPFAKDARCVLIITDNEDEEVHAMPERKITGRIVDFGDVTLDCAAVEVKLAGWPDKTLRMARHNFEKPEDLPAMEFYVEFNNFAGGHGLQMFEPATSAIAFMPAGPYRWYAYHSEIAMIFAPLEGVIDLPRGKLTTLELKLEPTHGTLVTFKSPVPWSTVELEVEYLAPNGETELVEYLNTSSPGVPLAVANPKKRAMRLTATTRGYAAVQADVAPGATECLMEFTTAVAVETGILKVLLPPLPDELKNVRFRMVLVATIKTDRREIRKPLENLESGSERFGNKEAASFEVEYGTVSVILRELDVMMGYPNQGLICGPVTAVLERGQTVTVTMPAIPPPPFSVFTSRARVRPTCDGQPVSLKVLVSIDGGKAQLMNLEHNATPRMPLAEYAVLDGETRIPFETDLPTKENQELCYHHDFTARVEVKVRRLGTPFEQDVEAAAIGERGELQCRARGPGKSVKLWLPRGKATVSVEIEGVGRVTRGGVEIKDTCTEVVFELEGSIARFEWDDRYQTEPGSAWHIRSDTGAFIGVLELLQSHVKLEPGRYVLTPVNAAKPEVPFDISADSDRTVHVPFAPALQLTATAQIRYPKELKQSPEGYYVDFRWYLPLTGNLDRDILSSRDAFGSSWQRTTHEGIKLFEMPAKTEFVLVIALAALSESSELTPVGWCIAPMRVMLTGEGVETLNVEWKRGAVLADDWEYERDFAWRPKSGALFEYGADWRVMLPGAYTVTFSVDGARKSVDIDLRATEEKFFSIPAEVRKMWDSTEPTEESSPGD